LLWRPAAIPEACHLAARSGPADCADGRDGWVLVWDLRQHYDLLLVSMPRTRGRTGHHMVLLAACAGERAVLGAVP